VRGIAQSALVLRQGTVAESGPVEQILEHPADPYTQRLVNDVPKLVAHLSSDIEALSAAGTITPRRTQPDDQDGASVKLLTAGLPWADVPHVAVP
jgi:ABC-type glutathione transport system ATPase component